MKLIHSSCGGFRLRLRGETGSGQPLADEYCKLVEGLRGLEQSCKACLAHGDVGVGWNRACVCMFDGAGAAANPLQGMAAGQAYQKVLSLIGWWPSSAIINQSLKGGEEEEKDEEACSICSIAAAVGSLAELHDWVGPS